MQFAVYLVYQKCNFHMAMSSLLSHDVKVCFASYYKTMHITYGHGIEIFLVKHTCSFLFNG